MGPSAGFLPARGALHEDDTAAPAGGKSGLWSARLDFGHTVRASWSPGALRACVTSDHPRPAGTPRHCSSNSGRCFGRSGRAGSEPEVRELLWPSLLLPGGASGDSRLSANKESSPVPCAGALTHALTGILIGMRSGTYTRAHAATHKGSHRRSQAHADVRTQGGAEVGSQCCVCKHRVYPCVIVD